MNRHVGFSCVALIVTSVLGMSTRASAPVGRYSINGGTVYDAKTKLTWQQAASATTYTWADAQTLCGNVGTVLGQSNWRLPTVKELQTLVDFANTANMIDPAYFGSASPQGLFWSSTQVVGASSPSAWVVGFDQEDGSIGAIAQSQKLYARCVR